jgi:hypothetical protein
MFYNRVYKLIDEFVSQAEKEETKAIDYGQALQERQMLMDFGWDFNRKLGAIISELGGEFLTLKERHFDPKLLQMLAKVHKELIEIKIKLTQHNPYEAATKLVHYVLSKPVAPIIDNLDFLAKHHLSTTNVDFESGKFLAHPQMRSLDKLKSLALELKKFMDEHQVQPLPIKTLVEEVPQPAPSTPEASPITMVAPKGRVE